jgi:nucleoside-diphosphate-sugar epimerase
LTAAGHEVIGLAASTRRAQAPSSPARIVVADALDRAAVGRVIEAEAPDAIVNMLTAIPPQVNPKRLAEDFALTNRLRTEGTANLVDAAAKAGPKAGNVRVISQGLAYAYDPGGESPADEDAPLWTTPPRQFAPVLKALQELEQRTIDADGTVLRLGHLYGPGTIYAPDGSFTQQVRDGKLPLVGGGTATFSFTHTSDVAAAVVAALESPHVGALNIVDDEPAPMHQWLPHFAKLLDARAPKGAPAFLARLAVGAWGVAFMTKLHGADNSRAKTVLDWKPRYSSWRTGFAAEIKGSTSTDAPLQ